MSTVCPHCGGDLPDRPSVTLDLTRDPEADARFAEVYGRLGELDQRPRRRRWWPGKGEVA